VGRSRAAAETLAVGRRMRKVLDRFRVTEAKGFRLKSFDPADTVGVELAKPEAEAVLARDVARLAELQELLHADGRWAVLCVFQGIDAAGKDGTIKHVMSGVNPQGVTVTSFKAPSQGELAHDFLWRVHNAIPERGRIGIFNRSHYEDVLAPRVHPDYLDSQRLPKTLIGQKFWQHRLSDISHFETYLARQGIAVLKFFLHLSRAEQRNRLLARLDEPDKHWKFSSADIAERAHWNAYQKWSESAIAATAAPHAPWFIIPADVKWFARLTVVAAIIEAMEAMDLSAPPLTAETAEAIREARATLLAEAPARP
jgi:PPK2 family polyphosphate:nucleotide phosphotransferase